MPFLIENVGQFFLRIGPITNKKTVNRRHPFHGTYHRINLTEKPSINQKKANNNIKSALSHRLLEIGSKFMTPVQ